MLAKMEEAEHPTHAPTLGGGGGGGLYPNHNEVDHLVSVFYQRYGSCMSLWNDFSQTTPVGLKPVRGSAYRDTGYNTPSWIGASISSQSAGGPGGSLIWGPRIYTRA